MDYRRRERTPVDATRRRKLVYSYAPDWIITILLAVVFFLLDNAHGFWRDFSLQETSLQHPYAVHERVPTFALVLICFVAPLVIQPLINWVSIRSWWDLHNSTLGLILSLAMAAVITQFSKITVGRPRPDIIDRCQPTSNAVDPTFGLSTAAICTQTDMAILRDGFRSFPSGHTSLSFAGLGFLAFYLAGKLHLFDRKGHLGKVWLFLAPLAAATLVAISRTMDYRHHWQDVVVGSILGLIVAYFSYRQYYPSLASELCHKPYSPRISRDADAPMLPLYHRQGSSVAEASTLPATQQSTEGTVPKPNDPEI
ncbi:phosphatidic acid phosphatase type 2/haloperoxidase [Rhodocollybia butyracea]|uniref:Phosphatidic acid phosphatase type 2/haloperoxidase n=1 Tax=Rhodocollybia butyracea TaxID=206335 RepID=A0A9P5PZ12_9AGAR|nr:phosphatidic acid phosphatase type 2/haloperoxidase [Rhodocollybia butyracea]